MSAAPLAYIPSPSIGVWHLGPIPLRGYAFCILLGIAVSVIVGQRRWAARGGDPNVIIDVATWAVPFGVLGGRIYHVITSPEAYFGHGGRPIQALYIWDGGLGIWGAILLGGVGAYIGCRRHGLLFPPMADALAPGIILAQAIGRFGNYFNNELYGRATTLPWGLKIHEWDSSAGHAVKDANGHPIILGTFQPTFLYESIWDVGTFFVLIWADRRFKLGHARVFALYMVIYAIGRSWVEYLRIDAATHILGLRLNDWTSLVTALAGLTVFIISARLHPGRETWVYREGFTPKSDGESPETPGEPEEKPEQSPDGAAQTR